MIEQLRGIEKEKILSGRELRIAISSISHQEKFEEKPIFKEIIERPKEDFTTSLDNRLSFKKKFKICMAIKKVRSGDYGKIFYLGRKLTPFELKGLKIYIEKYDTKTICI